MKEPVRRGYLRSILNIRDSVGKQLGAKALKMWRAADWKGTRLRCKRAVMLQEELAGHLQRLAQHFPNCVP